MYIQRNGRNPVRLPRVFAERMIAKGIFRPVNVQEEEPVEEVKVVKKRTKKAK